MLKFKSQTLIDMYGDTPNQYDISFLHYAFKVRNNSSKEFQLIEEDFDNLKKEVNDNQFKIYFYDISSFKEVIDNTNILDKYHDYIYVRINDESELIQLASLITNKNINAIIDYDLFTNFNVPNINLILKVDKIKELSSFKLIDLSKKYNIKEICLGTTICLNKEYCYELLNEYSNYYNFSINTNDEINYKSIISLFLSNDIYSIETYVKIEKELYKLIDQTIQDNYQKFYHIFYNLVNKALYNFQGLEEEVNENQNLIGVLINNQGVCEGFAKALYQACSLSNIECIIVSGGSSKVEGGHLWNQVCINGIWFNADAAVDSNLLREKGKLFLCLVNDKSILYQANSLIKHKCIYNFDFSMKNLTTDFLYKDDYIIRYNECDLNYIESLEKYIDTELKKLFTFFDLNHLKKKIIINLYSDIELYTKYRLGNISDTSVGNFDQDEYYYYVNILSFKEYVKRKGNNLKTIDDYFKLIIHELVHVVHEDFCSLEKSLIWIREGLAICLSGQYDNMEVLM